MILYEQIKKFIELDYQDKVLMSKNSRKHIEEVFDKRKIVKETVKGLGCMSEPIRVLQIVTTMNRGGLETMLMNYYRNIDRSKIQFDFLEHRSEESDL